MKKYGQVIRWGDKILMLEGSPDLAHATEGTPLNFEGETLNISDGMEPISIPPLITRANFAAIFGGTLPEGFSPDIFEGGDLELEQQ